jgi:hypothetical protein
MLTQQSPTAITTKMLCPVCGGCLRLTVVEPHYNGKRIDNHIFACSACKEIQTYVFDRTLSVSRPDLESGFHRRMRRTWNHAATHEGTQAGTRREPRRVMP